MLARELFAESADLLAAVPLPGHGIRVTAGLLPDWLGSDLVRDTLESPGSPVTDELLVAILDRGPRFVALVEGDNVVGVVDRFALGTAVATRLLGQRLKAPSLDLESPPPG